jgi:hypothetical protein
VTEETEAAARQRAFEVLTEGNELSSAQSRELQDMIGSLSELAREGTSVGDLKIANTALAEMAEAFRVFRPYRHVRKVTMFGSARTKPEDPIYLLARDLAAKLAAADWMIVTGAGPGIMAAGLEGAGRDHAFGVNIRLPFEGDANPFIAQDPKLVEMRYFFTRKGSPSSSRRSRHRHGSECCCVATLSRLAGCSGPFGEVPIFGCNKIACRRSPSASRNR